MILTIGIITSASVSIIALVLSIKAVTKEDEGYVRRRILKLEDSVSIMKDFIEHNHEGYSLKVEFKTGESITYKNVFKHYFEYLEFSTPEGFYRRPLRIYIGKLADRSPSVEIDRSLVESVTVIKEEDE